MLIRNQAEKSVKSKGSHQVGAVLNLRGVAGVEAVSGGALRTGTVRFPLALWRGRVEPALDLHITHTINTINYTTGKLGTRATEYTRDKCHCLTEISEDISKKSEHGVHLQMTLNFHSRNPQSWNFPYSDHHPPNSHLHCSWDTDSPKAQIYSHYMCA